MNPPGSRPYTLIIGSLSSSRYYCDLSYDQTLKEIVLYPSSEPHFGSEVIVYIHITFYGQANYLLCENATEYDF